MNKIIFPFLFLYICLPAFGQQEAAVEKNTYEVGLNTTTFIDNFFSPNDLSNNIGAYLLSLRVYRPGKKVLRMGLNLDANHFETKPHLDSRRVTDRYELEYRIGWEKQTSIHKRWIMLTGIDITSGYFGNFTSIHEDDGKIKTSTQTGHIGAGPNIGIQFNITDRIGVFTESTMYLRYNQSIERTAVLDNDPTKDTSFNINFNITLPTALFFFMKF